MPQQDPMSNVSTSVRTLPTTTPSRGPSSSKCAESVVNDAGANIHTTRRSPEATFRAQSSDIDTNNTVHNNKSRPSPAQHFPETFNPSCQFRVLVLENGEINFPISASFKIFTISPFDPPLTEVSGWEAVSYAWGNQTPVHEIYVDGNPIAVTENVINLLKDLRDTNHKRFLWIDAICINQGDEVEKSKQVPLMTMIYENAQATIIWLGSNGMEDEAFAANAAIEWLDTDVKKRPISLLEHRHSLMTCFKNENPQINCQNGPFHLITALERFQRIWVMEEAVLPKFLLVYLG